MSQPVQADDQALAEVRVLIVDDHDLFRSGLRNLLEDEGVQVVGEAGAGQEALNIVREVAPDVVVMDLNMPGMGGVEATRHISTIAPLTRVVMLTISDQDNDVIDAILAGACGYLLKDSSIQELMAGIRAAALGESLISPTIAAKVLQRVRASTKQPDIERSIRSELSGEEPHLQHPHEAADRQPHPGGRLRRPERNRLIRAKEPVAKELYAAGRAASARWRRQPSRVRSFPRSWSAVSSLRASPLSCARSSRSSPPSLAASSAIRRCRRNRSASSAIEEA